MTKVKNTLAEDIFDAFDSNANVKAFANVSVAFDHVCSHPVNNCVAAFVCFLVFV